MTQANKSEDGNVHGTEIAERLAHFSCGNCRKWWTIGDAPADKKIWHCPWCGTLQYFKNITKRK
jgi:hypothetical protein